LTLARLCHGGVKSSEDTIAKSLEGDYRPEHLFALRQSLTAYRYYQQLVITPGPACALAAPYRWRAIRGPRGAASQRTSLHCNRSFVVCSPEAGRRASQYQYSAWWCVQRRPSGKHTGCPLVVQRRKGIEQRVISES
jgi:hypothetical protein